MEAKKTRNKPEWPILTEAILSGLTEAITRMEADDNTDLEDDRYADFEAARDWLQRTRAAFAKAEGGGR